MFLKENADRKKEKKRQHSQLISVYNRLGKFPGSHPWRSPLLLTKIIKIHICRCFCGDFLSYFSGQLSTDVNQKKVEHLILNQDVNKIPQSFNSSLKIVKGNVDSFSDFLRTSFEKSIKSTKFCKNLKLTDVRSHHKKGKKDIKCN